jgi:general secretion pathway protein I
MDLRKMVRGRIKRKPMPCGRNIFSTTGFTLIEVVVAMAILGVALTVIIELFSGGLRLARTSAEYTKAVNYARMKMEEMAVKQTMEEGTQEGEFDHTFRWQVETKKVDVLSIEKGVDFKPPTELFQVKVNVLWKSGSRERSTYLETYRTIKLEDEEKKS